MGAVERRLLSGWPRMTADERAAYEAERTQSETERSGRNAVVAALIHAAFGYADVQLVPDVLGVALGLRLGVVVPLLLVALPVCRSLHRAGRHLTSELVQAAVAVLLTASVAAVMVLTRSPSAETYFVGLFTVLTFFALALRVRLEVAVSTVTAITLVAAAGVTGTTVLPELLQRQVVGVFVATSALLVIMVVSREVDLRRSFLLRRGLRDAVAQRDAGLAALQEANAELALLSEQDALTGVPNRRSLERGLRRWDADGAWGAAVMLDVDRFKSLNDRFGHPAGDECLRSVARALESCALRWGGSVARYGGEEFAVLLPHLDARSAERVVRELRRGAAGSLTDHLAVTVSAGWAVAAPADVVSGADLLRRADAAVLSAKSAGRDRAVRWSATIPSARTPDQVRG